jgi:hypothetical protein
MVFMRELYLHGAVVPIDLCGEVGWKCLYFACLSFDLRADLEVELEFLGRGVVMTMIGEELCMDLGLY